MQLGEFAADAIQQFAKEHNFNLQEEVDIIAGQGQTIWHLPLPHLFEGDQIRAHLDMAEISIIAAKTGITALSNFRVSDMALGRQGCPLFVAWDGLCATHPEKNVAVQNIGHQVEQLALLVLEIGIAEAELLVDALAHIVKGDVDGA